MASVMSLKYPVGKPCAEKRKHLSVVCDNSNCIRHVLGLCSNSDNKGDKFQRLNERPGVTRAVWLNRDAAHKPKATVLVCFFFILFFLELPECEGGPFGLCPTSLIATYFVQMLTVPH